MNEWISVEDRLPDHSGRKGIRVLAYRPDATFDKIEIVRYRRSCGFDGVWPVTLWAPLLSEPSD